ncbi:MAG: type II toxin-antitoxin system VapC family toxin [Fimbriimonadales bacterium]
MGEAHLLKLLLDTCTFFWLAVESGRLSGRAKEVIGDQASDVFLSSISTWEIVSKHRTGRMALPLPPDQLIRQLRQELLLLPLPLSDEDAFQARTLPKLHGDPFDRMLICQAIVNGCSIVTPDQAIAQYPIHTIW